MVNIQVGESSEDTYPCCWNKFKGDILQSWEWGEVQENLGKKVVRLKVEKESEIMSVATFIIEPTRFGQYVYCPRGPVLDWYSSNVNDVLMALVSFTRKNYPHAIAVKIDPALTGEFGGLIRSIGFRRSIRMQQVERTWILSLPADPEISEDDLLKICREQGMAQSLPRHVRKAVRNGVTVRVSDNIRDITHLVQVMDKLYADRGLHNRTSEYQAQFEVLAPEGKQRLLIAERENRVLGAFLINISENEVATMHGSVYEDIPVNWYVTKALYWEAIKFANSLGKSRFNFWGILPEEKMKPSHPRYGYSEFKQRFGGYAEDYIGAMDYVLKPVPYYLYNLQERYRKWRYKLD